VHPVTHEELLEDRLVSYLTEWCESLSEAKPGCAYLDCSVLYDRAGSVVQFAAKSPDNNIYTLVPQALMDPVLEDAAVRLSTFFKQTFWCNMNILKCCQAAQADRISKSGTDWASVVHLTE